MMREKIAEFVRLHAHTYKSFFLSTLLLPPRSLYAYKVPGIGAPQRIFLWLLASFLAIFNCDTLFYVSVK